jgi:hypothetical protein
VGTGSIASVVNTFPDVCSKKCCIFCHEHLGLKAATVFQFFHTVKDVENEQEVGVTYVYSEENL